MFFISACGITLQEASWMRGNLFLLLFESLLLRAQAGEVHYRGGKPTGGEDHVCSRGRFALFQWSGRLRAPTVRIWRRRRRRSCGGPERRRKVGFLLSDEVDRSSPPTAQIWELLEETLPERDAPGLLLQLKWS